MVDFCVRCGESVEKIQARRTVHRVNTGYDLFIPYALFAMLPLLEKGIQSQYRAILEGKDRKLEELHASLSWRMTAPLRKLRDLLFR